MEYVSVHDFAYHVERYCKGKLRLNFEDFKGIINTELIEGEPNWFCVIISLVLYKYYFELRKEIDHFVENDLKKVLSKKVTLDNLDEFVHVFHKFKKII